MKDDYTTNSHYLAYAFPFKRLGKCTFWTWEWKGLEKTPTTKTTTTKPSDIGGNHHVATEAHTISPYIECELHPHWVHSIVYGFYAMNCPGKKVRFLRCHDTCREGAGSLFKRCKRALNFNACLILLYSRREFGRSREGYGCRPQTEVSGMMFGKSFSNCVLET